MHLLSISHFSRGGKTAEELRNDLLHAEEQRFPHVAGQEAVQELRDTKAASGGKNTGIHLWKYGLGLAQMDGKGSQPQHMRRAQAWALKEGQS